MATNLDLSGVPASMVVGVAATGAVVTNQDATQQTWALSASPPGLTISPASGTLAAKGNQPVTITPRVAAQFTITLTGNPGPVSGSPASTVAIHVAVQRYLELIDDLEPLF